MKYAVLLLLCSSCVAQVETHCTTSGNNTTCTSYDIGAQQQQNYDAGYKLGAALGNAIVARRTPNIEHYCRQHPGAYVSTGQCPDASDIAHDVAAEWVQKHHDFHPTPENAKAMVAYMETQNLDPLNKKSYDFAFKHLKRAGQLN